jgi:hypothetical protein
VSSVSRLDSHRMRLRAMHIGRDIARRRDSFLDSAFRQPYDQREDASALGSARHGAMLEKVV